MLDDKRIKEAQNNIKEYMREDLFWKTKVYRKEILETYKKNYKESLNIAKKLLDENLSTLWVIVISYYSMYYIANAVLYKMGYKVGSKISHKITSNALIVFIRNRLKQNLIEDYESIKEEAFELMGKKADEVIFSFEKELKKRSLFQYESTEEIKRAKAKTSFERAKIFIFELEKLL